MGFYSQKLLRRLRELGLYVPEGTFIRRVQSGYWQKSAGAWCWCLEHVDMKHNGILSNIGSQYTVKACARAKALSVAHSVIGAEVFPEDKTGAE